MTSRGSPKGRAWRIMPSMSRLRRVDSRDEGLNVTRVTQRGIIRPRPGPMPSTSRLRRVDSRDEGLNVTRVTQRGIIRPSALARGA